MAEGHNSNDGPRRKRALVLESTPTSLSSSGSLAVSPWREWSATSVFDRCYDNGVNSPSATDCSDTSTLSSGRTSPFTTVSCGSSAAEACGVGRKRAATIMTHNSGLHPAPVLSPDFRTFHGRQPSFSEVSNSNNEGNDRSASCGPALSCGGIVMPWNLQELAEAIPFDGSLSCLSDLAIPSYANDLMDFVKRQPSFQACGVGRECLQFILMAPTSAAVKLHEEPLTYLNQGQSYELQCKTLGDDVLSSGCLFKSVVRITFHDRRLKYQERELLYQWKKMHSDERIMDADVPLSYNIFNVNTDAMGTMLEFVWDPAKITSIFIKMNCISTEFTARKHGGEKGVPFRLQVETFRHGVGLEHKKLHSGYAHLKVFRTKGADRKNKTDREKAEKRAGKEKYHQAYDYTILTETFSVALGDSEQCQSGDQGLAQSDAAAALPKVVVHNNVGSVSSPENDPDMGPPKAKMAKRNNPDSTNKLVMTCDSPDNRSCANEGGDESGALPIGATPNETVHWLRCHRFGPYLNTFSSFSGADLLRLSRDDLIQICGLADGIRLFNAVQQKKLQPRLTMYMRVPGAPAFHCVFLFSLTLEELVRKVCDLVQVQPAQVVDVYCQGPESINTHMNDEVVQNLPDRSRYSIDAMKSGAEQSDCYRILLKTCDEL